jgi:hypothetical protein
MRQAGAAARSMLEVKSRRKTVLSSADRGFGDACNGVASFGMRPFSMFPGFKLFQENSSDRLKHTGDLSGNFFPGRF